MLYRGHPGLAHAHAPRDRGLGLPLALPDPTYNASAGAGLTLGDAGPYSDLFGQYVFDGAMVGPYFTSGTSPSFGPLTLCGFPAGALPICGPFTSYVAGHYDPASGLDVSFSGVSVELASNTPYWSVGRIDAVGPALTLELVGLSISTGHPLAVLVGVLDGAIAAPLVLALVLLEYRRDEARRTGPTPVPRR